LLNNFSQTNQGIIESRPAIQASKGELILTKTFLQILLIFFVNTHFETKQSNESRLGFLVYRVDWEGRRGGSVSMKVDRLWILTSSAHLSKSSRCFIVEWSFMSHFFWVSFNSFGLWPKTFFRTSARNDKFHLQWSFHPEEQLVSYSTVTIWQRFSEKSVVEQPSRTFVMCTAQSETRYQNCQFELNWFTKAS
jgi:hypothetical protein